MVLGLGIFLYGMYQLEVGAKDLSARRLRAWLLRSTRTPLTSAASGSALTAILQSSSLVALLVLAFASAGIMPLANAIGVLFGANLGTTFTGWLVAVLGFKLDLEDFALPLIALGGASQVFFNTAPRVRAVGQLILGLGLLLFGLERMKDSVADLPATFDLDSLQGLPAIAYLLIGAAVTAVIQSSSAMLMITLAALNSNLISLAEAAAMVIGANVGTTSTVILGSLSGQVIKRQLAFAHSFFNFSVGIVAFVALLPLLPYLFSWAGLEDPLYSLVAFHSLFNLLGLGIFLPLTRRFADWIERLFARFKEQPSLLKGLPTREPMAAIPVLTEYVRRLWLKVIHLDLSLFDMSVNKLEISSEYKQKLREQGSLTPHFLDNYDNVKRMEGEVLRTVFKIQQQTLTPRQTEVTTRLLETTRSLVYSCKALKDILQNLQLLQADDSKYTAEQFQRQRAYHARLYSQLLNLLLGEHEKAYLQEEVERLLLENDRHQTHMDQLIYSAAEDAQAEDQLLSTQLNVNREIHHAAKNLLRALQSWISVME